MRNMTSGSTYSWIKNDHCGQFWILKYNFFLNLFIYLASKTITPGIQPVPARASKPEYPNNLFIL